MIKKTQEFLKLLMNFYVKFNMVKGIEKFKEYFRNFENEYVLIGGTACDLLFEEHDVDFRKTKDLDIVLIVEALNVEFVQRFWDFINEAGYENRRKSNGEPQFYRFDKPKNKDFPYMIELFGRNELITYDVNQTCIPIYSGEEISSLSAILLNESYYHMLIQGKKVISEIVVLSEIYIIPFKIKAFLDLKEKKKKEFMLIQKIF